MAKKKPKAPGLKKQHVSKTLSYIIWLILLGGAILLWKHYVAETTHDPLHTIGMWVITVGVIFDLIVIVFVTTSTEDGTGTINAACDDQYRYLTGNGETVANLVQGPAINPLVDAFLDNGTGIRARMAADSENTLTMPDGTRVDRTKWKTNGFIPKKVSDIIYSTFPGANGMRYNIGWDNVTGLCLILSPDRQPHNNVQVPPADTPVSSYNFIVGRRGYCPPECAGDPAGLRS